MQYQEVSAQLEQAREQATAEAEASCRRIDQLENVRAFEGERDSGS